MINLGVFFGSRSVEHEVSIITALQAINQLRESEDYNIVPIYIGKTGQWYTGDLLLDIENFKKLDQLLPKLQKVNLVKDGQTCLLQKMPLRLFSKNTIAQIDVAFPIFHGTYGEDGSFQGLCEFYDLPYAGCDVLSASVTMDKILSKMVLKEAGIPVVDYYWFTSDDWLNRQTFHTEHIERKFRYPVIVKPSNTGSSVGVSVAHNREELETSVDLVRKFSNRILIEKMVQNLMEINISVLGDADGAKLSLCEQPLTSDEFLTYEDKYVTGGKSKGMSSAKREIPAKISDGIRTEIETIALKSFAVLDCSGVSRLDFIVDKDDYSVYLNELNTIPGSLAFYLWEPAGLKYGDLLDQLVKLALKKDRRKRHLLFTNDSNILSGVKLGGIKK